MKTIQMIMSNPSNDESVVLPKDLCVLNALAMGIAIQMLAKITGEEIKAWKDYVGIKASEQYSQLSSEQIQEIVDTLEDL